MVAESPPEAAPAPAKPPDSPPSQTIQLLSMFTASLASRGLSLLDDFRLDLASPFYGRASPLQSRFADPTTSKHMSLAPLLLLSEAQPPALSPRSDPPPQFVFLPSLGSPISSSSPSANLFLLLETHLSWVVTMPRLHLLLEIIGLGVCEAIGFDLIIIQAPIKFSVNLDAMRGSTVLRRRWELEFSGVTLELFCLKLGSFYSCLRCVAAWCRILPWFNSLQSLVYLHPYKYYESLLLTSLNLYVIWVSDLNCSSSTMERSEYSIRVWWCLLVELPPMPPVPPDPPDSILSPLCHVLFWIRDSAVLTLSSIGDMSFVTAIISIAFIPPFSQGLILSSLWNVWKLTGLGSIARIIASRLKPLSLQLPLYEVVRLVSSSLLPLYEEPLPLYEDHLPLYEDPLPLYEDLITLPLYEDHVTLPLYEELVSVYREFLDSSSLLVSFTELFSPLDLPFVLNGWDTRSVIKGSNYRCLIALVAILEMGNCALVAVPISGVRSVPAASSYLTTQTSMRFEDFFATLNCLSAL